MVDSKGILHQERRDLVLRRAEFVDKWRRCLETNRDNRRGGPAEAIEGMDVVIAVSRPGPGLIKPAWIERMNRDGIVFACANPIPEIWPWEAQAAGAAIVATGRSDFPNQVNNSLGFPGIFRGALDVRARTITDEMCFAAAETLAAHTGADLAFDHLLPTMAEWEVFAEEAAAVGLQAQAQGVALKTKSREALHAEATALISRARRLTESMMETGFIPEASDAPEPDLSGS